jgi:hypothetical protein
MRAGLMRRKSWRRMVNPCRSKNSRIWIATLRPLSSRSRNSAAVNLPVGDALGDVDGNARPCPRRPGAKKWSCAISSTSPRRAAMRMQAPHEALVDVHGLGDVAHRVAAGTARRSGAARISAQMRSSSFEKRTSCCGRRTQVRSSTTFARFDQASQHAP